MDVPDGQSVEPDVDAVGGAPGIGVVGEAARPVRECLAQATRGARPVVSELTEVTAIDGDTVERLLEAVTTAGPR